MAKLAKVKREAYERGLKQGRKGGIKRSLAAIQGLRSAKQCREALEKMLTESGQKP